MSPTARSAIVACFGLIVAFARGVDARAAPSFSCKAAKSDVEKTICASKKLSTLDSQIADAYRAALTRLGKDAVAVAALTVAQRSFVATRDERFEYGNDRDALTDYLTEHRDFLRAMDVANRDGFYGTWKTLSSEVKIIKKKKEIDYVVAGSVDAGTGGAR